MIYMLLLFNHSMNFVESVVYPQRVRLELTSPSATTPVVMKQRCIINLFCCMHLSPSVVITIIMCHAKQCRR